MRQRGSERVWQQMGVGVQVTLVTGFLGSGKTTLINHVLKHADQRVAVVENEVHTHGHSGPLAHCMSSRPARAPSTASAPSQCTANQPLYASQPVHLVRILPPSHCTANHCTRVTQSPDCIFSLVAKRANDGVSLALTQVGEVAIDDQLIEGAAVTQTGPEVLSCPVTCCVGV